MKLISLFALLALLVVACEPAPQSTMPRPVVPDLPGAEATYFAAVQEATATANAATVEAQREAQIATATADFVRFEHEATRQAQEARATDIALEATATINATNGRATAVAFEQAALVSQRLIDDETARLNNQRQAEMIALQRQATINATIPFIIAAAVMIAIGAAILAGWVIWAHAKPTVITYPDRAPTVMVHNPDGWRVLPAPRTNAPDRMLPPPVEDAPRPVMLPALTKGHVLIVGNTGDGKSMALLGAVKSRGEAVTILDPHYTPGAWGNRRVIGAGGDYDAIINYMQWMNGELIRRMQLRAQGQREFEPLTFATEEMPSIVSEGGGGVGAVWRRLMHEGRKFGLYMIVVTQSRRVKTLGIEGEGDLLREFHHVILLGKSAKEDYPELVAGMPRPAVLLSGHNPPQPVVIPYDEREDPESPQFAPRLLTQAQPATDYAEPGMATEGGFVTRAEMDKMLSYERQGWSRRKISAELYGTEGGAAYQRVKGVLDALVGAVLPA